MTAFIFSDGRSVGIFRTVDLTVWTVRVMAVRKGLKRNPSNTVEQFISDILSRTKRKPGEFGETVFSLRSGSRDYPP